MNLKPKIEIVARSDAQGIERFGIRVTIPAWSRGWFGWASSKLTPDQDEIKWAYVDATGMVRIAHESYLSRVDIPFDIFWSDKAGAQKVMLAVRDLDLQPRSANQDYAQF